MTNHLFESLTYLNNRFVDPFEFHYDDGEEWLLTEPLAYGNQAFSENELALARTECRKLALSNEFAINAIENRINYVIGQGHRYKVIAKEQEDNDLAKKVQDILYDFMEKNHWTLRQQEMMRRQDRDGEVFIHFFPSRKGSAIIRFIEPEQIVTPEKGIGTPGLSFGIQSNVNDVESVLGYWIDGHYVEAKKILHRKANVDHNVKRGLSLFFPVRKNLRRAEKLLRNMSVVAEIQSAIALIRKHSSSSADSIRHFVQNHNNPKSPQNQEGMRFQHFPPGTIIDAKNGTDYEFPIAAIDASRYILVLQAELRAIASRLVMPEFMLSSDASNANYSSTMIAEGPAVRMFERLQRDFIDQDHFLFRQVIREEIEKSSLPWNTLKRMTIHVIPPILAVRNRYEEAKADEILFRLGVLSKETLAMRYGLDPAREQQLHCCDNGAQDQ